MHDQQSQKIRNHKSEEPEAQYFPIQCFLMKNKLKYEWWFLLIDLIR